MYGQSLFPDIQPTERRRWLVTGGAGFIGSHLVETLLTMGQEVVTLDNYSSGRRRTLAALLMDTRRPSKQLEVIYGDIRDLELCRTAARGCDHVLHHAALGSVPGSVVDPLGAYNVNEGGFLNVLVAAREANVKSLVFASSSAVYGDDLAPVKDEKQIGRVLSPYAAGKRANEAQAEAFGACYGLATVGLRYFNVYGPRQDPAGPYAAVIPAWLTALTNGTTVTINGDGTTSRDFCFMMDVVQANLRAALCGPPAGGCVLNIGSGQRTTLAELLAALRQELEVLGRPVTAEVRHGPFRKGDIQHSLADITLARSVLGYVPQYDLVEGLKRAFPYYLSEAFSEAALEMSHG